MRYWLTAALMLVFAVACSRSGDQPPFGPPATVGPVAIATATKPPQSKAPAAGVRVTLDGKEIPLEGEPKAYLEKTAQGAIVIIDAGQNVQEKTRSGYGVRLELQPAPGKVLHEGFGLADVGAVTLSVWKDDAYSYASATAAPGQAVKELSLERTTGTLVGWFAEGISGSAGKASARIEFNLSFST